MPDRANVTTFPITLTLPASYPSMSAEQRQHVYRVILTTGRAVMTKYSDGAKEHGGSNIWEQTPLELVDNAILEAVDQLVYLMTLKDKITGVFT